MQARTDHGTTGGGFALETAPSIIIINHHLGALIRGVAAEGGGGGSEGRGEGDAGQNP